MTEKELDKNAARRLAIIGTLRKSPAGTTGSPGRRITTGTAAARPRGQRACGTVPGGRRPAWSRRPPRSSASSSTCGAEHAAAYNPGLPVMS